MCMADRQDILVCVANAMMAVAIAITIRKFDQPTAMSFDLCCVRCDAAPNIKTARLLSARDAILNWANAPPPKPKSVTAILSEK